MKSTHRRDRVRIVALSGILTFFILCLLFYIKGIAPFGSVSLAVMDAQIQYLDFFSYFKDVLTGKNSIAYTFGKGLGGTNIAVYSYYLSSPFSLLVVFFGAQHMNCFFNIAAALKITMASIAFATFCVHRFNANKRPVITVLLSIGYALCQYNFAQSSNIMWLDGVYMLPFILLQVYNVVRGKKNWGLSVCVGLAIVFNWYSAGIDCIFSGFWFLFELGLFVLEKKPGKKEVFRVICRYVAAMLLGVTLSAALFFPTIMALKKSARGSLDLASLLDLSFLGELPSAMQKYTYGSISEYGSAALFCGSLSVILAISGLFNKNIPFKKRILMGGLFAFVLVSLYWHPIYSLFSMFQWVGSYYYRYSYVAIFTILFLAAYGNEAFTKKQIPTIVATSLVYVAVLLLLHYLKPIAAQNRVYGTAAMILLLCACYACAASVPQSRKCLRSILTFVFAGIFIVDLMINAHMMNDWYSIANVGDYEKYSANQKKMLSEIAATDDSDFRISQTTTFLMLEGNLTANYNEPLAFNYASISSYTSSPDDNQMQFLDRVGYALNGTNMCITNASILGTDALLGVKYTLSPYEIHGLEQVASFPDAGKTIFRNPYALPLAFVYAQQPDSGETGSSRNPFAYQNSLYSELFGLDDDLYTPVEYTLTRSEISDSFIIEIQTPPGENQTLYGYIPWNTPTSAAVYANNQLLTYYADWLSPTVFYIPAGESKTFLEVWGNYDCFSLDHVQIYALNLDVLNECAQIANSRQPDEFEIKNGRIQATVENGRQGDRLFLSVPSDTGWKIQLNGKNAETSLIGDCLYSIHLEEGTNHLTMVYSIEGLKAGAAISALTLIFIGVDSLIQRKKKRRANLSSQADLPLA